ncbi:VOC family protein [Rugosimonospora acidiphila]
MTPASFRDMCMDANDALALGRFWAAVLGERLDKQEDGTALLVPDSGRRAERMWMCPVPEPRGAKTRVHFDVRLPGAQPSDVIEAGATVIRAPGEHHWWVLADPEGNEFCAFPAKPADAASAAEPEDAAPAAEPEDAAPAAEPEGAQPAGVFELVVDSRDCLAQATWWSGIVGGEVRRADGGQFAWIEGASEFPWQYWVFVDVPEPKTVKNRLHWDVNLAGDRPDALLDAGASLLRSPGGDIGWWVLADPEGNEFCAFPAKP